MRQIIPLMMVITCFLSSFCFAVDTDIKKADELFEKGSFQEALNLYEAIFSETTDSEVHWKAFFRICESLAHLFRYGEAAEKVLFIPPPNQMLNNARILILKAEILKNFLMQYSYTQRGDVIDEEGKGVFRLTSDEIRDKIKETYSQLWSLRDKLVRMDIKKEGYFLDIKDIDLGMYPTVFDYLILSWTDFLLGAEGSHIKEDSVKPKADLLLVEEFKQLVDLNSPPALLAAQLMEEASRFNPRGRFESAERWKIKRLLLPSAYTTLFDLKNLTEDKTLSDYNDVLEYRKRAKSFLLEWLEKCKTIGAKAEAGYEAAVILNGANELVKAVELCKEIEKKYPDTYGSRHAQVLRSRIQMPTLELQAKTAMPPASEALTVTTKNIKKVYFRLYKISPQELRKEHTDYVLSTESGSIYRQYGGWHYIFNLGWSGYEWGKSLITSYLSTKTPYKEWVVETEDKDDHMSLTKIITPPELELGVYLVLACGDESFKIESSLLSACFLNVTDLILIGTAGLTTKGEEAYYDFIEGKGPARINDDAFHYYTLNAETGKPVEGADVNVYLSGPQQARQLYNLRTNKNGSASLAFLVKIDPYFHYSYDADPLATYKDSCSYFGSVQYFPNDLPYPIELFIETDRPIYRPGQKVYAKVVAVWRTPQGFKVLDNEQSITFSVSDPNYKDFFRKDIKLNEFGSADIVFEIPQGKLLGRYQVHVSCKKGDFYRSAFVGFTVEEYKRPEFEVTLKPAVEAWKYNEPVRIEGKVAYYFGGPVPKAAVSYRIKRQIYIPFYFRYFHMQNYSANAQDIASGQLETDSEGNFIIQFIPTPPPQIASENTPDIAQFLVEVECRDSGGRIIKTQESYKAGKNAIYFVIEPKKGFYLEKETIEIDLKRLTINDTAAAGMSNYKVFTLADMPTLPLSGRGYSYGGHWYPIPPLDIQLKDVPNERIITEGKIDSDKEGKGIIKLSPLSQGVYRIVITSQDEWGAEIKQNKIFVIAKSSEETVPVNAASVTLSDYNEYNVGDTARFIIGSGLGSGIYHIEIWAGDYLLSSQLIDGEQPIRLIDIPVTEEMKGGFSLRWFGVKNLNVSYGQTTVSVPWKEKKLKIALEPFDKELTPGQEINWGVKLTDADDKPIEGEVLALMYDRSLEYYMKTENPWLDSLYTLNITPLLLSYTNLEKRNGTNMPITEGLLEKLLKAFREPPKVPNLPGLRTGRTWVRGGHYLRKELREEEALGKTSDAVSFSSAMERKGEEAAKEIEVRKEFADTAFFKPHIITSDKDGRTQFTFISPEQLTSWRIKLFAFTKDVKEGTLTEEAVTKKDFMVRADLPRFFREGDKGTVTAIVHNELERPLKGELFIDITENGKAINEQLGLKDTKKSFKIEPHSLASFNWMIDIPKGVSTYKVRVSAVADKLSDAEERELPILPSRERLIESAFTALSGSESKTLQISLKDDPTRINESMVLQIDPQLALSILNTIPFLVKYPYECVEQTLNKYVPLSIMNEIYKKYPTLQTAVSKIPKRTTVTPPWEKDDPNRLITLMETPWVWESEGRPPDFPVIDLLDPEIVKSQKERTFAKLRSAQLQNGAFPWWPGGEADPYMTLYVLSGLAETKRYGIEVSHDMIQRALQYVNKEIPLLLKPEERELALVSFAAYVVTSFSPKEFPEAKKGHEAAKSWVVFLERYVHAMTPLGKAYLAYTYLHLGDEKKANELLDMAMDGAREDPIAGVYWTPEKYSWVWYSDTVEKHAFLLRTLQELRPEDKRIPGMVQWLLFNRKGTVWKSTKASAAAIYALLDYLNQKGALASDETFNVKWGKNTYSEVVKADDWLDKPIRWQKTGFEITPEMNKALIEKEGPGLAFAGMVWTYSTDQICEASGPGMLELERRFYRRVKEGNTYHLKAIKSGEEVSVGDQIEVQLKINTRSQFEYMHLKDLKAAGFEAETLLSGWRYDALRFYEEPRDSLTNFFIGRLPHGEYILRYRLRPTKPGIYRIGAATLQSMYSPEMTAHSSGFIIKVVE